MKPEPDAPHVYVQPIPDSEYSIRLFPGSYASREWGMDYVETATGQPANSPFAHTLWMPADASPIHMGAVGPLRSMESSMGLAQDKIRAGGEKWVLTDGQTYVIKRPGKKNVRFNVPIRPLPSQSSTGENLDEDVVVFPRVLQA
ncbi:uncharacterized protein BXZ73DRAFT_52960 [Epithele typhae]|uniref:uncharacterized protein n=1 Tax=Epithele typhae TaxID=378194 RepID=UPI00200774C1|nr:uncharacterized protein BXZ73DRAFT_52960 [Epithele typhae]KAH9918361.1 hypothetical protein BXZ73DRAFT_52960 [Epithele typhae]